MSPPLSLQEAQAFALRLGELDRSESLHDERAAGLRLRLADCAAASLLAAAGFRIEGPGAPQDGELRGSFWWTLMRAGWAGVECGPHFRSAMQVRGDAVPALLNDEDLDWSSRAVRRHASSQFPDDFAARMNSLE